MKELCFKEKQHNITLWENILESFRLGFKSWLCDLSPAGLGIGELNI